MAFLAKYRSEQPNVVTGEASSLCPDCYSIAGKPDGYGQILYSAMFSHNAEVRILCDRCLWIDGIAHELQRNRYNGPRWIRELCKIADETMTSYRDSDVHIDLCEYVRRGDGQYIWLVDRSHTSMYGVGALQGNYDFASYKFWNDPGNGTDATRRYLINTEADTIHTLDYADGLALLDANHRALLAS